MSKRQFKSQASSSRAATGAGFGGFGSTSASSTLSYLTEPPNLSSVSDANVVVAFKNLSKKDGTTKSKALEDLRAYVQAHPYEQDGGVEEAVLEAWVRTCQVKVARFVLIYTRSNSTLACPLTTPAVFASSLISCKSTF